MADLLGEHRIVVWYDGEGVFIDFISNFQPAHSKLISASKSGLKARREAEAICRAMNESNNPALAKMNLLIYVPRPRGAIPETRQIDPFEVFALAGVAFGDKEADQLASLARRALPNHIPEIDRLFAEGRPSLPILDSLEDGQNWPVLQAAFKTESSVEIIARVLLKEDDAQLISTTQGAQEELLRLLKSSLLFTRLGYPKEFQGSADHSLWFCH